MNQVKFGTSVMSASARQKFIDAVWDRHEDLIRSEHHAEAAKLREIIPKLHHGDQTIRSGTYPSIVWNNAVEAAAELGVRAR